MPQDPQHDLRAQPITSSCFEAIFEQGQNRAGHAVRRNDVGAVCAAVPHFQPEKLSLMLIFDVRKTERINRVNFAYCGFRG